MDKSVQLRLITACQMLNPKLYSATAIERAEGKELWLVQPNWEAITSYMYNKFPLTYFLCNLTGLLTDCRRLSTQYRAARYTFPLPSISPSRRLVRILLPYFLIMPRPRRRGGIINCHRTSVVCLSVRLSVCLWPCGVPQHYSKTERPRKPKIGRVEAHHTGIQWTYLEVKRSKLKVTGPGPINVRQIEVVSRTIETAQYLANGKFKSIKVGIK